MSKKLITTSHSQFNCLRACPKKYYFRYVKGLEPLEKSEALTFGSLIHSCLEEWHGSGNLEAIRDIIDKGLPQRSVDYNQKRLWHYARAMMRAYVRKYRHEDFEVIHLETKIAGDIINPASKHPSKTFSFVLIVDMIIKRDGLYYLMEHKTTASLSSGYIETLQTNTQPFLYVPYVEQHYGIKISGIIYNVLGKPRLEQRQGETLEAYEYRLQEAMKNNASGKSSAKRKIPETDEEFAERLDKWYADPSEVRLYRHEIYIERSKIDEELAHLWDNTQTLLFIRRSGVYYKNRQMCYQYRSPCEFFQLCGLYDETSVDMVASNHFKQRKPKDEEQSTQETLF